MQKFGCSAWPCSFFVCSEDTSNRMKGNESRTLKAPERMVIPLTVFPGLRLFFLRNMAERMEKIRRVRRIVRQKIQSPLKKGGFFDELRKTYFQSACFLLD